METLLQDVRYGIRSLAKTPGFTAAVVVALALGIGANSAIFSIVNAIMLRPLAYEEPERLVAVWATRENRPGTQSPFSVPTFLDLADQNRTLRGLSAYHDTTLIRTGGREPERLVAARASTNLFDVLGVRAALGRTFVPDEATEGAHRSAVLGDGFWKRAFGADPSAVGRTMTLDGETYTIVGVLPEGFTYPMRTDEFDLWVPLAPTADELDSRGGRFLSVLGRLAPGVSADQAQADLAALVKRIGEIDPDAEGGRSVGIGSLHEEVVGEARTPLYILLGAVAFVLLIACANVANLMLARASARQREVAVRSALGASRSRVVRQFLTESVVIALAGSGLGLLLAYWGLDLLLALASSTGLPRSSEIGVDSRVLAFTVTIATLTGLAFGIVPALQASRVNLNESLKDGSLTTSGGPRRQRARAVFVVAQVALAFVLLVGSGLSLRSLTQLLTADPGFDPNDVLTMTVSLPDYSYSEGEQLVAFHHQLLERLEAIPGVESTGTIMPVPFSNTNLSLSLSVDGRPPLPPGEYLSANFRAVSPGYFGTMRIPIVRGRGVTDQDREGAPNVVVVNETMAATVFPGEDPIGQRITIGYNDLSCEIVGIVGDVKFAGLDDTTPRLEMYTPYVQTPWPSVDIAVRTTGEPEAVASAVRAAVQGVDKNLPVFDVHPMTERLAESLARQRLQAVLLGLFATVALVLAALGIYSVLSYLVTQRTHEIGIRLAIGAQQRDVLGLVFREGFVLALVGLGVGLVGALALMRAMSSVLFGVSATDPLSYAVVAALLLAVAALASYVPARRATRVDPLVALKYE